MATNSQTVNMADVQSGAVVTAEEDEDNILYDLLINTEWPPELDTQVGQREPSQAPRCTADCVGTRRSDVLHVMFGLLLQCKHVSDTDAPICHGES